ncbi:hypothetical protein JGI3_02256 [Candidatus Kryptobacter tengchongensis]|nr:hypothetical protein JGI3_02256 [Candidatus Kryptobacter tengchongensis]
MPDPKKDIQKMKVLKSIKHLTSLSPDLANDPLALRIFCKNGEKNIGYCVKILNENDKVKFIFDDSRELILNINEITGIETFKFKSGRDHFINHNLCDEEEINIA